MKKENRTPAVQFCPTLRGGLLIFFFFLNKNQTGSWKKTQEQILKNLDVATVS